MRFIMRLIIVLLISLWCMHGLVIESSAGNANELNIALYHSRVSTLDPHVQNSTEKSIVRMTCEPLTGRYKDTVKIIPILATSWKISDDAKVFTYFLRKGVKFQDGTPFNAQAVKFNFDRISDLKKGFYWMLSSLEKVEVIDDYTICFTLKESFTPFLSVLEYFPIVSPKSVLDHEKDKGDYAKEWYIDHNVGTGPYKLIEWQHGVKIVHEKYDEYWGGWEGNHAEKITNWIIPESGTQRMMLEKGELDIIQNFTIDDFKSYQKNPNFLALEKNSMAPMYIRLNYVAGPTKNLKVRQAISYCFDWDLYESLVGGHIQKSDGPCPKELIGGWKPNNVITEHNPEKAKALLKEAGYPNGFEMTMIVQKGTPSMRVVGEVWQQGLAKVGVKLKIVILPWAAIVSKLNKWAVTRDPSSADNSYIQFIGVRLPDPFAYLYLAYGTEAQSGKGRNWMLYSNPKVDELTEKAIKTLDLNERTEIYKTALQMIADDCPDVFVDKIIDRTVMRKVVKGFYFDPLYPNALPYFDLYKVGP